MYSYPHSRALCREVAPRTNADGRQALIMSDMAREGNNVADRALKLSTSGIIFFGTPHLGGNKVQAGEVLVNIIGLVVDTNQRALRSLRPESEFLRQQMAQFANISSDFNTIFAYEVYDTQIGPKRIRVSQSSSGAPRQNMSCLTPNMLCPHPLPAAFMFWLIELADGPFAQDR